MILQIFNSTRNILKLSGLVSGMNSQKMSQTQPLRCFKKHVLEPLKYYNTNIGG